MPAGIAALDDYGRSPRVLIYADPPYLGSTRKSGRYKHEMLTDDQHAELAAALHAARAAVVVSGYASPLYERLYDGWDRVDIPTTTGQGGARQDRVEVLWSNRPIRRPPAVLRPMTGRPAAPTAGPWRIEPMASTRDSA